MGGRRLQNGCLEGERGWSHAFAPLTSAAVCKMRISTIVSHEKNNQKRLRAAGAFLCRFAPEFDIDVCWNL